MQLKTMIEMTKGFDLKILIRKSSHIDVVEINFFNSVGNVLDS